MDEKVTFLEFNNLLLGIFQKSPDPSPLGFTCAAIKIDEISAVSSLSSDDNDECRDKQQHELPKFNGVLACHTMPLAVASWNLQ